MEDKLEKIKKTTGYTLEEIINLPVYKFHSEMTKLYLANKLTKVQYDWLDRQRTGHGLDQMTLTALDIFGGKIVSK